MSVKKHYMESQHCVPGHFRLAQSIQVECMSSLCSLWFILNINKNNLSRETLTFIHVQSQFYIRPLYTLYTVQNRIIFLFSGYINTYGEIEIIDVNIQIYSFKYPISCSSLCLYSLCLSTRIQFMTRVNIYGLNTKLSHWACLRLPVISFFKSCFFCLDCS